MAEKRLTQLIEEITNRYNTHYNTNFTVKQLEPVIRFQWSKIAEALLIKTDTPFIKIPDLCHVKLRPIKTLRRFNALDKLLAKKPKTERGQISHRERWQEASRLRDLLKSWKVIDKQREKHYKKYFLNHPDANPITFINKLDLTRYEPKKTVEGKE